MDISAVSELSDAYFISDLYIISCARLRFGKEIKILTPKISKGAITRSCDSTLISYIPFVTPKSARRREGKLSLHPVAYSELVYNIAYLSGLCTELFAYIRHIDL